MSILLKLVATVACIFAIPCVATADDLLPSESSPNESQWILIRNFADAVAEHDMDFLRSTYHAKYFDCLTDTNRSHADRESEIVLGYDIPNEYEAQIEPFSFDIPSGFREFNDTIREYYDWPADPTHVVVLWWADHPNRSSAVRIPIASYQGHWYVVMTCLNEKGGCLARKYAAGQVIVVTAS